MVPYISCDNHMTIYSYDQMHAEHIAMAKMFEDQLVPELNHGLPANWDIQHQCVETHDLSPASEEWKHCEKLVTKSLPVTITKITRIQNMWLLEAYNFNKARMRVRNDGIIHEMDLFHGSGSNDPLEIACGEEGLDLRLSRGGSWGYAIYLTESAQYSDRFAYLTASDERVIIIAKALIGISYDFGTSKKKELRMPPVKENSKQNVANIRYDSVSGITKNARVFMLYHNYRAYPSYIVYYKSTSA